MFSLALLALTAPGPQPMLFPGMGPHHRAVSTHSAIAQRYFDQGLAMTFGFNKEEAVIAFRKAADLDPKCAMAYWGIALASGPDINMPFVDPDRAKVAWDALTKAKALEANATPVERALIDAGCTRFSATYSPDRTKLDQAYADAMRQVWHRFPHDGDAGALFAESLLDLRPWHQWKHDGAPAPGTMEAIQTLRSILRLDPNHPQALHLLIHATEGSPHPEWAANAADRLRFLEPGLGHMVHMPSHTDVRMGQWQKAIDANNHAIAEDLAFRKKRGKLNFYAFYIVHNYHMRGYAAMMIGHSKQALASIDGMASIIPADKAKELAGFIDGYVPMGLEARIRFGKWDEILAAPDYPDYFPLARSIRRYARAVAFAAKGDVASAKQEQDAFEIEAAMVPDGFVFDQNSGKTILELCRKMMSGEIALAENHLDAAITDLRQAVKLETSMDYSEPPDWIMPTRHALGAVLVKAGKFKEAEQVYRADLAWLPHNGWSLYGLSQALAGEGRTGEARRTQSEFALAWKGADMAIDSSCMCCSKKH